MSLTTPQKCVLAQASRSSICDAMSRLRDGWQANNWFPTRNRYRKVAVDRVKTDSSNNDAFVHSQMRDYVAASVLGHCYDGWSFLARALEAELSGDPDAARHLGYYAELRAAMSILASEGIGVFDTCHVVALGNRKCQSLRAGSTHVFTWDALEYWATLPRSSDTLFKSIRPAGISLRDWLVAFGGGVGFLATMWLRQWGLDLSRLVEDRKARNLSSYRPTPLTSPGPQSISAVLGAVTQLWQLCAPGSRGEFSSMDRHLLRLGLEMLFKSQNGRSPKQASRRYRGYIANLVHGQALADGERVRLSQLLNYEIDPDTPELLLAAGRAHRPHHIDHSRQVLARATLLLRVATGSLSSLLADSDAVFLSDLSFWWTQPSVRRRLWPESGVPDALDDLWTDVKDALDSVHDSPHLATASDCRNSFWTSCSQSVAVLTTPERIFLWGVSS